MAPEPFKSLVIGKNAGLCDNLTGLNNSFSGDGCGLRCPNTVGDTQAHKEITNQLYKRYVGSVGEAVIVSGDQQLWRNWQYAQDLKSCGNNPVWVQVPPVAAISPFV